MVKMDNQTKAFLKSDKMPGEIEIRNRKFFLKKYEGSGYKGVVWKGKNEYNLDVAIKFTIREDYDDRSYLKEAELANKLSDSQYFARFLDVGTVELNISDTEKRIFVCFVEEFVLGETLEEHLKNNSNIKTSFLKAYIENMCQALNDLKVAGLFHDDLHLANIKIIPPKKGQLNQIESSLKIIDTGSLKDQPSKKTKDDHLWFVTHIIEIKNAIIRRKRLSKNEKGFLEKTNRLLGTMIDEDITRALRDPSAITKQFSAIWKESMYPSFPKEDNTLDDPFYYLSAEIIPNDSLLVELFAESCPWKKRVSSPDMIVLTGPRGCGKSTIFRRMSLKGMLYKGINEVESSQIAGFYISCSTDFKNRVSWINTKNLAKRYEGEILHYFNLLLLREIVSTLNVVSIREDRIRIFRFDNSDEIQFYNFVTGKLHIIDSKKLLLQGSSPIKHLLELVESDLENCHSTMKRGTSLLQKTDVSFISDITNYLSSKNQFFGQRKIVFFVDDLSTRIIPKYVQIALNQIIFDRPSNHIFKVSSDKYGWEIGEDRTFIDKYREFEEIDCGTYFVNADEKTKINFSNDILELRLELSKYKGTPESIIGHSIYQEKSLGKEIRARARRREKINDIYFGIETISNLCSGDISVLIDVYRKIFEYGKITPASNQTVSSFTQNKAILEVSREYHQFIKSYQPYGEEMYKISTEFGKLSRKILRESEYRNAKDKSLIPETSRIYVEEDLSEPSLGLNPEQSEKMTELVKRTIFIELEPSRARDGYTKLIRWQLRPILCPVFGISLANSGAIQWKPEAFRFFISSPEDACNSEYTKVWKAEKNEEDKDLQTLDRWSPQQSED